jgi:hypothetical protein
MLNNRRRITDAQFRRARRWAAFSMLFAVRPMHMVVSVFAVLGLVVITARELAPHHWPGACYEAQIEIRVGRHPSRIPVCVKHIPFADPLSARHAG